MNEDHHFAILTDSLILLVNSPDSSRILRSLEIRQILRSFEMKQTVCRTVEFNHFLALCTQFVVPYAHRRTIFDLLRRISTYGFTLWLRYHSSQSYSDP